MLLPTMMSETNEDEARLKHCVSHYVLMASISFGS